MGNSKGLSIAALVCGILGIIGTWIPVVCYFTFLLAIAGIVCGAMGLKKAKANGESKGLAMAGFVCGIVGTAFGLIGVLCAICAICALGQLGAELGNLAGTLQ